MNWVLAHMADADFAAPFQSPAPAPSSSSSSSSTTPGPDEESVAMVMSLGFSQEQAIRALKATVGLAKEVLLICT